MISPLVVDPAGSLYDDREALSAVDPAAVKAACEQTQAAIVADDAAGTVTMTLAQAWGPFLATIAQTWGSVMDKEWVVENGGWDGSCDTWQNFYAMTSEDDPFTAIANGTGPFKLDHWTKGEEIVLAAQRRLLAHRTRLGRWPDRSCQARACCHQERRRVRHPLCHVPGWRCRQPAWSALRLITPRLIRWSAKSAIMTAPPAASTPAPLWATALVPSACYIGLPAGYSHGCVLQLEYCHLRAEPLHWLRQAGWQRHPG